MLGSYYFAPSGMPSMPSFTCYELSKGLIFIFTEHYRVMDTIFITFLQHDLHLFLNSRNWISLPNMHDFYLKIFLSFHLGRQPPSVRMIIFSCSSIYHGEWNYCFSYVACTVDENDFWMSTSFVEFTLFRDFHDVDCLFLYTLYFVM